MTYLNIPGGTMPVTTPQPNATVMSLYKYAPPTPSPSTPAVAPLPQLSQLGSVNNGQLPTPSQPPHGPAILAPQKTAHTFG